MRVNKLCAESCSVAEVMAEARSGAMPRCGSILVCPSKRPAVVCYEWAFFPERRSRLISTRPSHLCNAGLAKAPVAGRAAPMSCGLCFGTPPTAGGASQAQTDIANGYGRRDALERHKPFMLAARRTERPVHCHLAAFAVIGPARVASGARDRIALHDRIGRWRRASLNHVSDAYRRMQAETIVLFQPYRSE